MTSPVSPDLVLLWYIIHSAKVIDIKPHLPTPLFPLERIQGVVPFFSALPLSTPDFSTRSLGLLRTHFIALLALIGYQQRC